MRSLACYRVKRSVKREEEDKRDEGEGDGERKIEIEIEIEIDREIERDREREKSNILASLVSRGTFGVGFHPLLCEEA